MKVSVSATFGNGAAVSVEVGDEDMLADDPDFASRPASYKYKHLGAKADIFCLDFLRKKHEISDEFFADRAAEIRVGLQ